MDGIAQSLFVHTVALSVHTYAQSAPHLLPLGGGTVGVAQGAYLEHIGIIPALTQSGVGENKPRRFVKTQQTLLVFQYQVVGRNVVCGVFATLHLTVDRVTFLVDGEVAVVHFRGRETPQIVLVVVLEQRQIFIQVTAVFVFEHLPQGAFRLVSVAVVALVIGHLVDKEQRECLDALLEQGTLFLEVRLDGLTNLYLLDGFLAYISHHLTLAQRLSVLEVDGVGAWIDLCYDIFLVGRKPGGIE